MSVPPGYTGPTQIGPDGERWPVHMLPTQEAEVLEPVKKAAPRKKAPAKKATAKAAPAKKAAPATKKAVAKKAAKKR